MQVHPPLIPVLLLLTALGGIWSIILGVMSLGDVWIFGLLLIGAGACVCWATLGKLAAAKIRPKGAFVLLLAGIAAYAIAIVLAQKLYDEQQVRYHNLQLSDRGPVFQLPSEAERQVFTYAMIRDSSLASAGLAAVSCAYAGVRIVSRKRLVTDRQETGGS
jgi:hypothetical protein